MRHRSCQSERVPASAREARELRAVAPLFADGTWIGAVTIVQNGDKTIAATDADVLRPYVGKKLTIATQLDGSAPIEIAKWGLSRHAGLGLLDLATPVPAGRDVIALDLGAVCASVDARGSSAALVGIVRNGERYARSWTPVQLDLDDGGMADSPSRIASPLDDDGAHVAGAALFAWFPPNPALGRASEVLVLGLAQAYRGFAKPRARPVIAEIIGLDDLGRALLTAAKVPEREPELVQVAGEIDIR
jgi:hypothetical protein